MRQLDNPHCKEHRIWRVFRDIGLAVSGEASNMLSLARHSRIRIGMTTFYSMPSPPSTPGWSGVAGLRRLFGARVMRSIETAEGLRIERLVRQFMPKGGFIFVFQKDAYENIRTPHSTQYAVELAMDGKLWTQFKYDPDVKVVCLPPTRRLNGKSAKHSLRQAVKRVLTAVPLG